MFGKKEQKQEEPVEPTEVIESQSQEEGNDVAKNFVVEEPVAPPKQPEEVQLPERYREYIEKYNKSFQKEDFVNGEQQHLHNILFGIWNELRELKEAYKEANFRKY